MGEFIDREKLLNQNGVGPWTENYNFYNDYRKNARLWHKKVKLIEPDIRSSVPVLSFFYRALSMYFYKWEQRWNFDLFITKESLIKDEDKKEEPQWSEEIEWQKGMTLFMISLHRMGLSATRGSADSSEALVMLYNTVRYGGRIAFIAADGNNYEYVDHVRYKMVSEFRVFDRGLSMPLNEAIQDISSIEKRGHLRYSALYFNACNPCNSPIDMGTKENPVSIPVIICTDINQVICAPAKVYWPPTTEKILL